jgi:hypothetical protein
LLTPSERFILLELEDVLLPDIGTTGTEVVLRKSNEPAMLSRAMLDKSPVLVDLMYVLGSKPDELAAFVQLARRVGKTPYVNILVLGSAPPLDFAGRPFHHAGECGQ